MPRRPNNSEGLPKGKFTRKLENFDEHVKDKVALQILEDSYSLIAETLEEIELAN